MRDPILARPRPPDGPAPRCTHCGAQFTTSTARDNHEPNCPDNPNREPDPLRRD